MKDCKNMEDDYLWYLPTLIGYRKANILNETIYYFQKVYSSKTEDMEQ